MLHDLDGAQAEAPTSPAVQRLLRRPGFVSGRGQTGDLRRLPLPGAAGVRAALEKIARYHDAIAHTFYRA